MSRRKWLALPGSRSTHEAAITGLTKGLVDAQGYGASSVRLIVRDRVLKGILWWGWRPRAHGMVAAVTRLVEADDGIKVTFVSEIEPGSR